MTYSGPDSLPLKSRSPQSPSNSGSVSVTEQLQSTSPQSPANSVTVVVPAIVASFMMILIDFDDMMIPDCTDVGFMHVFTHIGNIPIYGCDDLNLFMKDLLF